MAGAIAELARKALSADFRSIDPRAARVMLIESGPGFSPPFIPICPRRRAAPSRMLGVEVRLGKPATRCDEFGVEVDGGWIDARTVIWAAGVMASPAHRWLGVEADRAGRVNVNPDLSVPGHPGHLRDRRHRALSPAPTGGRCLASRRWPSSRARTWRN